MASDFKYDILKALKNEHDQIAVYEAAAFRALDAGKVEEYTAKMREKAILLAELDANMESLLAERNGTFWEGVKREIAGFSKNANLSLDLDSVFFMAALLYPEDHVKGMPDNLQKLITKIEKNCPEM